MSSPPGPVRARARRSASHDDAPRVPGPGPRATRRCWATACTADAGSRGPSPRASSTTTRHVGGHDGHDRRRRRRPRRSRGPTSSSRRCGPRAERGRCLPDDHDHGPAAASGGGGAAWAGGRRRRGDGHPAGPSSADRGLPCPRHHRGELDAVLAALDAVEGEEFADDASYHLRRLLGRDRGRRRHPTSSGSASWARSA